MATFATSNDKATSYKHLRQVFLRCNVALKNVKRDGFN